MTRGIALVGATLLGAALAGAQALQAPSPAAPNAAVLVNGQAIEKAELRRALAALGSDKRNPLTEDDRRRVLNRLVEEELLIQRAVEIGLVERDRTVRNAIVAAMITHATAQSDVEAEAVDEEALRLWYAENRDFFRAQPQFQLVTLAVARPDPDRIRAVEAALARGAPLAPLKRAHHDPTWPEILPKTLLPLSKIQDYLGGEVAEALRPVPKGGWVGPYRKDGAAVFYGVERRVDPAAPAFDEARGRIEAGYRRKRADEAFRAYLDWLRERAAIIESAEQ